MQPLAPADELDALFAAPVLATVGGQCVRVRGVAMGELAQFLRLYERSHAGAEQDGAEQLAETAGWLAEMQAMAATLSGWPLEWIEALDDEGLAQMFDAMGRANRVLFDSGRPRSGPRNEKTYTWATAVAQLVECGHALEAVRGYSVGQVEQLMMAHARLAAERRIDELTIARAAQADTKGFKNAVSALEKARTALG